MEEEIIDREQKEDQKSKIYTMRSIWIGTFLGGPLTTGYLVAENYRALGQRDKIGPTWVIAIVATVIIFGGIFLVPQPENIPTHLIPLVYSGIAYYIINKIQGEQVNKYVREDGVAFSAWRSAGIGLVCAVITILPIFGYFLLNDPVLTAEKKTYGQLQHEIYFPTNVSEKEADQIADALTQTNFFDQEQQKSLLLDKKDGGYIISIPLIDGAWDEPDIVRYYEMLRSDLLTFFPDNPVVINLCDGEDITIVRQELK